MPFDPITEGIAFARSLVERIFPNAENKEQRAQEIAVMLSDRDLKRDLAQADINKVEAASTRIFIAGWRPFIGWVCGVNLAYVWIGRDLLMWLIVLVGWTVPTPPLVMQEHMFELLLGLLGLGTLRTIEKIKGVK